MPNKPTRRARATTRRTAHVLIEADAVQVDCMTVAILTSCRCGHPLTAVSHSVRGAQTIIRRKFSDHRWSS